MKIIAKSSLSKYVLKAVFDKEKINSEIIKETNVITEDINKKVAYIYLGKDLTYDSVKAASIAIAKSKRDYQIDLKTFYGQKVTEEHVINLLVSKYHFENPDIYNVKTKKTKPKDLTLFNVSSDGKKHFTKAKVLAQAVEYTRNLQAMPPNLLHSEAYAQKIKTDFAKFKNLSVKVLNKKQITDLKMGLLLSVNKGSAYEPRVVIIEYKGNPKNKEKTAIIGKGITFDAGGYNIKVGKYMAGMKFDMSGSAAVAGAMMAIASLKPKSNISAVLVMTDNMISSTASTPDSVWHAMNGKSVEINNTDAEGRLAMADGLTYAANKLKATKLIDIATLTGAVIAALGSTYTGVWTTTDKDWTMMHEAACRADELIWRMPLHKDYSKFIKKSKVADIFNTDLSGKAGSSSAAMFLTNFTEGKDYIHLDIAGTADIDGIPQGAMVKTLYEVANG